MKLKDLLEVCCCSGDNINIYVCNNEKRNYELFVNNSSNILDYYEKLEKIKEYNVYRIKPICVASESSVVSGNISVFSKLEVYVYLWRNKLYE